MSGQSAWASAALASVCLLAVFEALPVSGSLSPADDGMGRDRRAPFSAWAGKRSSSEEYGSPEVDQLLHELEEFYEQQHHPAMMDDVELAKRAPFSSWAGKRAPFSAWAGKRAPFSSWAGKRAPFSSWAGKRSSSEEDYDGLILPEHATSHAGHRVKRSSAEYESEEVAGEPRVRRGVGFSAWGGKRSLVDSNDARKRIARNTNAVEEGHKVVRPARAAFSAWGGK